MRVVNITQTQSLSGGGAAKLQRKTKATKNSTPTTNNAVLPKVAPKKGIHFVSAVPDRNGVYESFSG